MPLDELPAVLRAGVSPQGAFAFMCAQSLFMPCVATFGMIYKETGSLRLLAFILAYTFVLPLVAAIAVFQVANLAATIFV